MPDFEGFRYGVDHSADTFMTVFYIIFGIIAAVALFLAIRGLYIWNRNNHSPRQSEEAEVYTKRQDFSTFCHRSRGFAPYSSVYTSYFVVFDTKSSGKIRLKVRSSDFDYLREGEKGVLTFQGTRFLGFEA